MPEKDMFEGRQVKTRRGRRSVEVRHAEERRGDCAKYIAVEGLGFVEANAAIGREFPVSSWQLAGCGSTWEERREEG